MLSMQKFGRKLEWSSDSLEDAMNIQSFLVLQQFVFPGSHNSEKSRFNFVNLI